jgi:outer membrane protein TolC
VVDFVNVLTVQGALLATQEQWVESSTGVSLAMVGLYRALGGGWESVYPDENRTAVLPGVAKAPAGVDGSAVADLK